MQVVVVLFLGALVVGLAIMALSLSIAVFVAAMPAIAAAAIAYGLLLLLARHRIVALIGDAGSRFDGFRAARSGNALSISVSRDAIGRLVQTSRFAIAGGACLAGLLATLALAEWSSRFSHLRMWAGSGSRGTISIDEDFAVVCAILLITFAIVAIELRWSIGAFLERLIESSIEARTTRNRQSWSALARLGSLDTELGAHATALKANHASYLRLVDQYLDANASAIVREPRVFDKQLAEFLVAATRQEREYARVAQSYSTAVAELIGAGKVVARYGNSSMFATLEALRESLEIQREEFLVRGDSDEFLSEASSIQEMIQGIAHQAINPSASPEAPQTTKDPYELLGVPRDVDLDTLRKVYRQLTNIYHEGSSVGPNTVRWQEINSAYQRIEETLTTPSRSR